MKRIGVVLVLFAILLSSLSACRNSDPKDPTGTSAEITGTGTQEQPDPEIPDENEGEALRVMSFNVHNSLSTVGSGLTNASQNRVDAVKAEIAMYSPDLLGLQEDVVAWTKHLKLDGYTHIYDPEVTGSYENCSIWFKSGLTCMDYGWQWLTSDGTKATVALTVADITGNGAYALTAEELATLKITSDTPNNFLRDAQNVTYTDAEGNEKTANNVNYLTARRMTYVVLDVKGQKIIYVNTHLQHRTQDAVYMTDALLNLRNAERLKQFSLIQNKIEELKKEYADALVIVTGDFNDLPSGEIYSKVCEYYLDSSAKAQATIGLKGTWNSAYSATAEGANYPSSAPSSGDILDYCFVSEGFTVKTYRTGLGYATIQSGESEKTIYTSDHKCIVVDLRFQADGTPDAPDEPLKFPDDGNTEEPDGPDDPGQGDVEDDGSTVPLEDPSAPTSPVSVYSGTPDTSWFTGDKKEYVLTTADQLMGFMKLRQSEENSFVGITVKLGANMVINSGTAAEIKAAAQKHDWIGAASSNVFQGKLDGDGHYISGVYLVAAENQTAVFGTLGGYAVIKNISLVNSYINGDSKESIASFAGTLGTESRITILNVLSSCVIENAGQKSGGILAATGAASEVTLKQCVFSGSISCIDGAMLIGGIVGDSGDGALSIGHCKFTGILNLQQNAKSALYSGGILGQKKTAKGSLSVLNCVNSGTINGAAGTGGIVGYMESVPNVTISKCIFSGTISAKTAYGHGRVAGIVGGFQKINTEAAENAAVISDCAVFGSISSEKDQNGAVISFANNDNNVLVSRILIACNATGLDSIFGGYTNNTEKSKVILEDVVYISGLYDSGLAKSWEKSYSAVTQKDEGITGKTMEEVKGTKLFDSWTAKENDYPMPFAEE